MQLTERARKEHKIKMWAVTGNDPVVRNIVIAKLEERTLPLIERQIYTGSESPMIIEICFEIAEELADGREGGLKNFTIYSKTRNGTTGWRTWNEGKQSLDPSANFIRARRLQDKERDLIHLKGSLTKRPLASTR